MGLSDSISWFQSELVYYDAWLWDTSIEQRILRELGTKAEKAIGCNNDRVDLDVLNGSAYKNKAKHDWTTEVWRGIKTTAFASIHWDYWFRHTSPSVANYIVFHFALQLLQVICYLMLDPRTTKVTTSDILVPMALGVGLGILHAQITAYDPQRLKRKRSSPPAPVNTTADAEPPQSPTSLPVPSPPPQSQVNFSNVVGSIPQLDAVLTEKPVKESTFSTSNRVTNEISDQPNSQQSTEVKENELKTKQSPDSNEVEGKKSEAAENPNPIPHRRRALSLKIVPTEDEDVLTNLGINSAHAEFSPSSSSISPDRGLGVLNVKIPTYFRKRSASLSPDFCLNLPAAPLEEKIKLFKEAKMRGVTDPEVLADIQHQQEQQQLSPILINVPEWEEGVEEGDEESGGEDAEIIDSALPPNETNSKVNGDVSKQQIPPPKEEGPKVVSGGHNSNEPRELDQVREEDENEEDEKDERVKGEELEGGPEEADVDDNDLDEDEVELNDTFTAHRRQRANFYKIFVQRASYHRHHTQRSKSGEEVQTSIELNTTPPESMSALPTSKTSSNSIITMAPSNRRGSIAAPKRSSMTSGRTKSMNFMKNNFSVESIGHPASETEYERMNSDVRSDESSSDSDEQSALRESASNDHRIEASAAECPTFPSGTKKSKYQPGQQLKHLSLRTVGLTEEGSPNRTASPENVLGIHSTGTVDRTGLMSPVEEQAVGPGSTEVAGSDAPFALWYFHTIQGMSDPSYAQSESVSCYVWEGRHMRKSNFTLLDIGWRIIQAVERQKVSNIYPKAAAAIVFFLTTLPLFFHICSHSTSNRPPNASVRVGPLPEAELLAFTTNPFKTPGTLVLYLYHKIANFMTHIWFPTRQGVWDDVLRLATLDNLVIALGIFLRFNIYAVIFFLLCVAERAFQQRHFYAKHFFALTSSHRARRCCIPHLRLNKVAHVKCWLTLRSYLKKRGPQRSVECIVTATFYLAFGFGLMFCYQFLWYGSSQRQGVFSSPLSWDILAYTAGLSVFLLRFLTLGLKITKKFRNVSVLISEQLNLHLCLNRKPQKKDELITTNQVLKMAESLLKEVDGPYRICGWAVNPLIYNIFKLVLLSCFSAFISEILGFKLKLYKLKLNPANW